MSGLLVDPHAPVTEPATDASPRGPEERSPAPRRRRRPRWAAAAALTAVLATTAWIAPPVGLTQADAVTFDADTVNRTIEEFDERGMYTLRYVHGEAAEIRVPVRNTGWLPTTVTGIALDGRPSPMIVPLGTMGTPVALAPGETATVAIRVRFDHCEYYTERAIDLYDGVTVATSTLGLGATHEVVLDHHLAVRSAVMTTCPDRVSDRAAYQRRG